MQNKFVTENPPPHDRYSRLFIIRIISIDDRKNTYLSNTTIILLRVYHEIFSEYSPGLNVYTCDTTVSFSHKHNERKTVENSVYRAVFKTINNVTSLTTIIIYALYCIGR